MNGLQSVAMDAVEIDEFLADRRTGVLSLARDDGYAVPVSFVYDADDRALYFRLGCWPDSRKRAFVESVETPDVPFVTIFDRPREDVEFHATRLDPHELSGRKQATGAA